MYDHESTNDFSSPIYFLIGKILGGRNSAVFQMATGRMSKGATAYTPPSYIAFHLQSEVQRDRSSNLALADVDESRVLTVLCSIKQASLIFLFCSLSFLSLSACAKRFGSPQCKTKWCFLFWLLYFAISLTFLHRERVSIAIRFGH